MKNIRSFIFLGCICFFALASCDTFKKVPNSGRNTSGLESIEGRKKYKNKKGRLSNKDLEKVDTIIWSSRPDDISIRNERKVVVIDDKPDDIQVKDDPREKVTYGTYNLAILIPALSNRLNPNSDGISSKISLRALQFYGGAKLALYHLENEGMNFNVSVYDTKGSPSELSRILSEPGVQNANMLIGPYRKQLVQQTASFAKQNKKILISPWNPSTGISRENPYYIQVKPFLKTHCEAIIDNVKSRFRSDQIRLLARSNPKELPLFSYFQKQNQVTEGGAASRIVELAVPENSDFDLSGQFIEGDTTVFIIPSWNENFVGDILRQIYSARGRNPVIVYGMPQWQDFEKISYDYYEKLNVHISASSYVDFKSTKVNLFSQDFYNLYGVLPTDDAFLGYDSTLYFGRMLAKHGAYFQYKIDSESDERLHTKFQFETMYKEGDDSFSTIEQFENKYVNILRFQNYMFKRLN